MYKTKVKNIDDLYGRSSIIFLNKRDFEVSSPMANDIFSTNPEQLLVLAFVTCLNSTYEEY